MRKKLAALLPEPPPPPISRDADSEPEAQPHDDEQSANPSSISYARLLSRVFADDVGQCQHCGGDLRLVACIDDPNAIKKILTHLGLPTAAPSAAPARSPPQVQFPDWDNLS